MRARDPRPDRPRGVGAVGRRAATARVAASLRSAPGTYIYLLVLLVTTSVLETSTAPVARRLLQERSTNLHHLSRDPVRVLISSAFWVSDVWQFVLWLVLFTVLVAPVERWLGTGRTVAVFFTGHVGATLITAAGLWAAVRTDLAESSVVNARDVGASYGFFAVAALLAYRMQGRRRIAYLGGLVAFIAIEFGVSPDFTAFGHLAALAIGLASSRLIPAARRPGRPRTATGDADAGAPGAGLAGATSLAAGRARVANSRLVLAPRPGGGKGGRVDAARVAGGEGEDLEVA